MENILVPSVKIKDLDQPLPADIELVSIRFVNIGPKTLEEVGCSGLKICEIVEKQPDFFIISHSSEDIRKILHDYVDRFCDAREGKI